MPKELRSVAASFVGTRLRSAAERVGRAAAVLVADDASAVIEGTPDTQRIPAVSQTTAAPLPTPAGGTRVVVENSALLTRVQVFDHNQVVARFELKAGLGLDELIGLLRRATV